jgi:cobaltochelatase CobN
MRTRHLIVALLGLAASLHAQTPQPCIAYVGVWERAEAMLTEASAERGFTSIFARPGEITSSSAQKDQATDSCDLVFVLNMEAIEATRLRDRYLANAPSHPKRKIFALDFRASQADLQKANLLVPDPQISKYWRANGTVNIRRLLAYVGIQYLGEKGSIQPPVEVPDFGYYDPDNEEGYFPNFEQYKQFKVSRGRWKEGAPVADLIIQQSFWITHDTKVIAAQVRALERHNINPVVIFGDREPMIAALLLETKPDALIEDRHGTMWESRALLEKLNVPYFRPISMLASTVDEWKENPQGLTARDVGLFMTLQESWGTIEPIIVGGLQASIQGLHMHEADEPGVERFASRVESWLHLRAKSNSEKRVALIYYNSELGKDDLMRGSPTGMFLDGPASATIFLREMKKRGYRVDPAPQNEQELVNWMRDRGRNIGPWGADALESLVAHGDPVLIPESQYNTWFKEKLSPANQAKIIASYGPPPGKFMVVERNGEKFIVLPRIQLGNVVLMPQPARGVLQDSTLVHSRDVPPPHNYLAFYWWLQNDFHADAIMHWGTHGTLEMLPGKEAGMTSEDWSDICVGNMPNIDLWITDNLAEATLARRRSYAVLSDHLPPPAVNAGLADQYKLLSEDITKFEALESGLVKEKYRARISAALDESRISETLKLPHPVKLTDEQIRKAAAYIEELAEAREPLTLHTLGQLPDPAQLPGYLTTIGGKKFADDLAAVMDQDSRVSPLQHRAKLRKAGEQLIREVVFQNKPAPFVLTPDLEKDLAFAREMKTKLNDANQEIEGLFRALDAKFMPPGPGPDPIRNPSTAPGGRNLYSLNPEEIPTKPAWEVAVQLIDDFLKNHKLKKIGIDLNGMTTMRDFGVTEAQILYLMGVKPVWDRNGLASDVQLIPASELKRPRIDVFIAMGGLYKENFPTRVQLLDKAVRLVSALNEPENYVRLGTLENEKRLLAKGMPAAQAASLAAARVFGTKTGDMSGTNIVYLVPNSGAWDTREDVTEVYIDHMSYVYTEGAWGKKIDGLYEQNIQGTEALIRVWASNMSSQLSNHHAYEYLGGLSMAVKKLTGKQPEAFIADVRDPNGARMRDFDEVLATDFRTQLLNPNWIKGMQSHGFAGAGQVAELVKNTFGWTVTREGSVSDTTWNELYAVYFQDKYHLGIRQWMEKDNPHALQEAAAIMLEATRKRYWHADPAVRSQIARVFSELVAKHGGSGGIVVGGNKNLKTYINNLVNAPGPAISSLAAPGPLKQAALHRSAASLPKVHARLRPLDLARPAEITGRRMTLQSISAPKISVAGKRLSLFTIVASSLLALFVIALGFVTRRGSF